MISVIVPVHNEQENIHPLVQEILEASRHAPITEIVYVDDASTDATLASLQALKASIPSLRILSHVVKSGQSAAFMSGVRAARNPLVLLMDGDGQNNPADISLLFSCYQTHKEQAEQKIAVAGQRAKRQDNLLRRFSSRLANSIRSALLRDGIRDTGCSLKLIGREDYLALPYFDHMHRFLPALLRRDGVQILTVDVSHRPRERGISKYGFWDRLWVGIADLIGVRWLLQRGRPHAFKERELL